MRVFISMGVINIMNNGVLGNNIILIIVVMVLLRIKGCCLFNLFYVLLEVEFIMGCIISFMMGVIN